MAERVWRPGVYLSTSPTVPRGLPRVKIHARGQVSERTDNSCVTFPIACILLGFVTEARGAGGMQHPTQQGRQDAEDDCVGTNTLHCIVMERIHGAYSASSLVAFQYRAAASCSSDDIFPERHVQNTPSPICDT